MKIVPKSDVIYAFSPHMKPILSVRPGETVQFETLDALGGQIHNEEDVMNLDFSKVNPATGPVFVEGAEAGKTLVVEIIDIKVTSDRGVIVAEEGLGVLRDVVKGFRAKILPIRDGNVLFNDLSISIRPMIGVIGVDLRSRSFPPAPRTGTAATWTQRRSRLGARSIFPSFKKVPCSRSVTCTPS